MTIYDRGYIDLADAIVLQAIKDYRNVDNPKQNIDKAEVESFFRSEWFDTLTSVNPDDLLERLGQKI